MSLAQLRVIRIFPPTADALHTSIALQAFDIPLVATVKVPMCPVDSSRVHTFPVLIPAKVCIKCFIENISIHIKNKMFSLLASRMLLAIPAADTLLVKHPHAVGAHLPFGAKLLLHCLFQSRCLGAGTTL